LVALCKRKPRRKLVTLTTEPLRLFERTKNTLPHRKENMNPLEAILTALQDDILSDPYTIWEAEKLEDGKIHIVLIDGTECILSIKVTLTPERKT
jgi:hypothetical protein